MFNKWYVRMRSGFIWLSRLCVVYIYSLHRRLIIPEAGLRPKPKTHTKPARGEIFVCSAKRPYRFWSPLSLLPRQCGQGVRLTTHPHLVQGLTMGSRSMPTQWHVSNKTPVSDMQGAHAPTHATAHTQTQKTRNRPINATQRNVLYMSRPWRQRYSSNPLAIRHWNEVDGQHHAAAALTRLKTQYLLSRRRRNRSGRHMENLAPTTGIRSPDRPARNESLYRLNYRWLHVQILQEAKHNDKLYLFYVLRPSKPLKTVFVPLWKRSHCALDCSGNTNSDHIKPYTPEIHADNTGLFEMIVGVLTTCHTQYTWDRSICIFLLNKTTLQLFVTYL